MADLDEVSSQIGELVAISRSTQNQVTTLFAKFDRMNEEVIEQRGAIKILGSQFVEHKSESAKVHSTVSGLKTEVEAAKNKGKGLAIGLGLVGGGGGIAGFTAAAKAFFGGGS